MKLLLIDLDTAAVERLNAVLSGAGIHCRSLSGEHCDLYRELQHWPADIILSCIDSPHRDTLEHFAHSHANSPQTIIELGGRSSESIARLASELQLSLYAINSLRDSLLQALLDTIICQLRSLDQLKTEMAAARFTLEQRNHTQQAVSYIVDKFALRPQQAEELLRKNAHLQRRSIEEVAEGLLAGGELAAMAT